MKKFLSTKERTHIDLAAVHGENSLDAASESATVACPVQQSSYVVAPSASGRILKLDA